MPKLRFDDIYAVILLWHGYMRYNSKSTISKNARIRFSIERFLPISDSQNAFLKRIYRLDGVQTSIERLFGAPRVSLNAYIL